MGRRRPVQLSAVGFYFLRKSASDAGKKAFIANRVGDAGFLLGLFVLVGTLGTLRFTEIAPAIEAGHFAIGSGAMTAIALLLFVGATGKSAQIPLYVWLPDAMEGPTPVSALIHAATMVTAGVYMITRMNVVFQLAPVALGVIATIGAVTALYAATMALVQTDIKRVLAYSTISQLGYMFLALGVGAFTSGIFHLMTHAFFKALLFLGSGSVIHAMSGEQDMRRMGGLWGKIPKTAIDISDCDHRDFGNPAVRRFRQQRCDSRGLVQRAPAALGSRLHHRGPDGFLHVSPGEHDLFRRLARIREAEHHMHESPPSMTVPLMILAGLSIVGGWIGWPEALGGSDRFAHFLDPVIARHAEAVAAVPESSIALQRSSD